MLSPRLPAAVPPGRPIALLCGRHACTHPPVTIRSSSLLVPLDPARDFFKLHKLRALRRKTKHKGGRLSTDPDDMASAQEPLSPTSSKRSRSRDSTRSGTNSSLNTPAGHTPAITPAASANSLLIPSSTPSTPSNGEAYIQDGTPYPAFLRLGKGEQNAKWNRLEFAQIERMRDLTTAQQNGTVETYDFARCNGEQYAPLNRYANVDPYQGNRVKLDVPEGSLDYINASPVVLESTKTGEPIKFIATQGPKGDSFAHFWRMLWKENQDPAVVIMLTQTYETGREKCYPYYPQTLDSPELFINEQDEFGDGFQHILTLVSRTDDESARTEVREIDMISTDDSESRKTWHLLFAGWPDFSVPEGADRAALLKLVDMSRDKNGDNASNPRIVHCSAGIGRSGTFIALDWLMQELDEGSLDDVPDTTDPVVFCIESLRDQRAGMVQSKNQFLFLYDTIRERWRERWIANHPAEAAKLGIRSASPSSDSEPALKRQKSMREEGSPLGQVSQNAEQRAALEAELAGAAMSYE